MCIAQALIGEPEIIILDEPTVGLDPQERSSFLKLIAALSGQRIILFSTHIVSDLDRIAEHIIFLKKGVIAAGGKVSDIIKTLEGKVFEININEDELEDIKRNYHVVSMKRIDNRILTRIICDRVPNMETGTAVSPGLEDVYFSIFKQPGDTTGAFEA